MKLYLSSYGLGKEKDFLEKWIKEHNNKVLVIVNAMDIYRDGKSRVGRIIKKCKELKELGVELTLLDLRYYFDKKEKLIESLKDFKTVYVHGGNVFILNRAMRLSGFNEYLMSKVNDDDFLYFGQGSGACVLSKSLEGLNLIDTSEYDPYNSKIDPMIGLGILDYLIVPHFKTDNPEMPNMDKVINYLEEKKSNYKPLSDGDVIVESTKKMEKEI